MSMIQWPPATIEMPEDNAEQQKPVGPFENFEACVQHFQDDPEVDDEDALCGWMEENQGKTAVQEYQPSEGEVEELVSAMKDPATSSVLTDLEVSFVSGVEDPAQDSQWVMAKDTQERGADWGVTAPLLVFPDHGAAAKQDTIEEMDFGDYPDEAVENARMALEAREETGNPNDCGTQVGWERANQLDNGENLSPETVARMSNFRRHQENYDPDASREDCGWMMWKAWGGEAGVSWAEDKFDKIEEARKSVDSAIALESDQEGEQQKAWAPVLIPNETDKQGDVIPPEAIEQAAHKFVSEFRNIDTDHDLLEGKGTPIESWTLKEAQNFTLPDGSESREYQKGTWMLGVEFSDEAWDRIKSGELTGFSIYGEATEHSVSELLGDGVDLEMGAGASAAQATAKQTDSSEDTEMENETDSGDQGEAVKALPEEAVQMLAGSVDAMLADEDTEPDAVNLDEFIQWALDNGEFETDSVMIGGTEFTAENGGGENSGNGEESDEETPDEEMQTEDQQMENETPEDSPDEGEPSTKELLEDVRDTVKSTQESVEQHGERIEELEDAVFEKDEAEQPEAEQPEAEQEAPEAPNTEEVEQAATEAAEDEVKALLGIEELPDDPEDRQEIVRKHLHEQPDEGTGVGNPDSWSEDEVSEVVR